MKSPVKTFKRVAALVGAIGLVASFTVFASAATSTVHQGAAASAYCFPSDKANRKQARDAAQQASAAASDDADSAAAVVTKRHKELTALIAQQKKAKAAYYKTHKGISQRAAFVAAQNKVLAKAKLALANAQAAAADAASAAARAATAAKSAQAAYDQCS